MRADALAEMVERDLANGDLPCAIVATVGTTATTAIDPIAPIAEIARRHGAWLHVDAAMAGSAMILPECRWMWDGIEAANSLVINAHKWLGAPFDCSVYYVRDPEHLMRRDVDQPELPAIRQSPERSRTCATGASRSGAASGR